ncbi:hypothetical protein [Sulfurospirillum sp. 1612]|uniref:hypothetical protein n=1 Tax=Sulfurospirillum sp. 1612 TaxID=3094835 RepID=UPI002F92CB09
MQDDEIIKAFETFDEDKDSLVISSSSLDNIPLTNYSPFVKKEGAYYICVSSNLPHYKNMIETKRAHVMIIEDEKDAEHIYARKRLYFGVSCELEPDQESIFKLFDARYGTALSFMRNMKDFKVIKLIPHEKSLVLGFGAAYRMNLKGELEYKKIKHQ